MRKPYLVILGGIGDTGKKSYSFLKDELRANFEIISITYPGFGNVSSPKKPTIDSYIKLIEEQIKSQISDKTRPIIVFSHSIGTAYGFKLCYQNDLDISALIVANPFTAMNISILNIFINGVKERRKLNKWWRSNHITIEFRPFNIKSIPKILSYIKIGSSFMKFDVTDNLPKLNIPVLALIGDKDQLIPPRLQLAELNKIKNVQVEHFDEGHYFVHTRISKVARLIREFAKSSEINL